MANLLTVSEFSYGNAHPEVLLEDGHQLLRAMKKQYPNCNFSIVTSKDGKKTKLTLQVVGANDFQRLGMTYFADGFMASAHLWER